MNIVLKPSDHLLLSMILSLRFRKSDLENCVVFPEVINHLSFVVEVEASGLKSLDLNIFILLHDSLAV